MEGKYTVTNVDERSRFGPGGKRSVVFVISIETARGSTGTVTIDQADYTREEIEKRLNVLYERLELPFGL